MSKNLRGRVARLERSDADAGNQPGGIVWTNLLARSPAEIVPDGFDWSPLFEDHSNDPDPLEELIRLAGLPAGERGDETEPDQFVAPDPTTEAPAAASPDH